MELMMKTHFTKQLLIGVLSAAAFFCLPVQAEAQSSCTKKMLKDLNGASNECVAEQFEDLKAKIKKRYVEISADLPDVSTPASADEYEGPSKAQMNAVYESWEAYQDKACTAEVANYGMRRTSANRAYRICWTNAAKKHLASLK
jgi:hypothetical protein